MAELENKTAEVVDEVAEEVVERLIALEPREGHLLIIGGLVGFIGGAIIGGTIINRRLRLKYAQIADAEIDTMREHFRAIQIAREEKPDLSTVVSINNREGYTAPNAGNGNAPESPTEVDKDREVTEEPEDEELPEAQNVFETDTSKDAGDGWDYKEEVRLRRPDRPYVIHIDERHESGYTESTLTYYAEDEVLCDERDEVIGDPEKVVGTVLIDDKFGHGSNDQNVVYIRNDMLAIEVEVIKNEGSYAEVVHGLEHSDEPRSRRRRRFDDEPDDR